MIKVMIVEDEPPIANSIRLLLEESSDEVKVTKIAINGKRALQALERERVDLVFTDIRMPVMDGIELSKSLGEKYPNIVTVIISGYQEFEYARSALKYGVFDYLLKPVSRENMQEILAKCVDEIRLRKRRAFQRNLVEQHYAENPPKIGDLEAFTETDGDGAVCESVAAYIREHYQKNITGEELARRFGMSAVRLSRQFRNHFGISISNYLNQFRVETAKVLLKSGKVMVKEAAASVGFSDQYYFSKTFKKITGVWPREYAGRKVPTGE